MEDLKIDNRIIAGVRRQERVFLRNISLISGVIAILYVSGFTWRCAYYHALGIPASMVEVPFPMVLVPRVHVTVFLAQVILTFLAVGYYNFYKREKRANRAKLMGITEPLDLIVNYGLRRSVKSAGKAKTNQVILYDFLREYVVRPDHQESDWRFDIKEFDKEAVELFPDMPPEIRRSFVWYELQLLVLDRGEMAETIRDSLGSYPEGSKLFDKLTSSLVYAWFPMVVLAAMYWSFEILKPILYGALGVGVGLALATFVHREDRYQFWHMLWISVVLLIVLNAIDGHTTARADLKGPNLPIATISTKSGQEQKGLLLASFSDGYFLVPLDANDVYRRIKIQKDEVRSISYTTVSWLLKSLEATKEQLQTHLQKTDEFLNEAKQTLNKVKDPNCAD